MKYSKADAKARGKEYRFDDLSSVSPTTSQLSIGSWPSLPKRIIYDVEPHYMDGIGVSDDPLIEMRTAVYLMSGRIRREADHVE